MGPLELFIIWVQFDDISTLGSSDVSLVAARAPCDVFDPWVRWERGQVGI